MSNTRNCRSNRSLARIRRYCASALIASVVGLILPVNVAHAIPIGINLSSGTFANPGLGAGDPHSTGTAITWNYTGNFADPRYVAYVSTFGAPGLTPFHSTHMGFGAATSNTTYGPDVPGGTPAYTGVEFYYVTFSLPGNATNVSMAFSREDADDRTQLQLNNQLIGYWGGSGGTGQMIGLGSQASVSGVLFNAAFTNHPTLTDQSLFNIGGENVLRFWVNNTGTSDVSAGITPHSSGNPSTLDFRAALSYDAAAVPEPAILALLGLGLAALQFSRRKRAS